jgi:hypothetical protein
MSFSIIKPSNWEQLPLYKKITYYGTQLDKQFSIYVDKIEAKKIVKDICGNDITVLPIIRIIKNPDDFVVDDLDVNTIIKASHGSGWNFNITSQTTVHHIRYRLKQWDKIYSTTERQYSYISPRFFIEQKIDGTNGNADVIMFRCIHGQPVSIGFKRGRLQNSYDIDWNPITEIQIKDIEKPSKLSKMIDLAKTLAKPFEFVRMDFFYANDNIYFSEFTFTPSAGSPFFPMNLEKKFGSMWT